MFRHIKSSTVGSFLIHVSTFLSVVSHYQASVRHASGTTILQSDLPSQNSTPVITRPIRCAPSSLEPGTLLSEACLFVISSKATSAFHTPADLPGWLFSPNAQIYTTHTHIFFNGTIHQTIAESRC